MRRETLFNAVKKIVEDLKNSGILEMFERGMEELHGRPPNKEARTGWVSFEVFQKYSLATSSYSDVEFKVLQIINLEELSTPLFWSKLSDGDPHIIFSKQNNIRFALNHLPQILHLMEQDYVESFKNPSTKVPQQLAGKSLLTVLLVEDQGQFSSPLRLVYILKAITSLYSVVATIEGEGEGELAVLACDSGSDKSFDFLGLAKLMEEVRIIILSIWDRRVFHRHLHVSQCMNLIAESLPIIQKIHDLKESGALGPEQAEILKRKAIEGATEYLESGALISEMDGHAIQSPRMLMRPEPKLLTGPQAQEADCELSSEENDTDSSGSSDMSPEEIAELERLVNKAKSNAQKPKKPKKALNG